MPVCPSGVSVISACHYRTFRSLDELWIFWVGPATFENGRAVESETHKTPSTLQACSFFTNSEFFLGILFLDPRFFFHHIVPQVCQSVWHFESSSPLFWNPRYFEKGDLLEHFASKRWFAWAFFKHFFFCCAISHEYQHAKLMTSLIINLSLVISLCALLGRFHPPDSFAKPPDSWALLLYFPYGNLATLIAPDRLFLNVRSVHAVPFTWKFWGHPCLCRSLFGFSG